MAKNKDTAERPKKRGLRILLLIILPAALLTAVYIRCNPKWKAAELTIEPAGRFFDIECLEPEGADLETRIVSAAPRRYEAACL